MAVSRGEFARAKIGDIRGSQVRRITLADFQDRSGIAGAPLDTLRTTFAPFAARPFRTTLAFQPLRAARSLLATLATLAAFSSPSRLTALADIALRSGLARLALRPLYAGRPTRVTKDKHGPVAACQAQDSIDIHLCRDDPASIPAVPSIATGRPLRACIPGRTGESLNALFALNARIALRPRLAPQSLWTFRTTLTGLAGNALRPLLAPLAPQSRLATFALNALRSFGTDDRP